MYVPVPAQKMKTKGQNLRGGLGDRLGRDARALERRGDEAGWGAVEGLDGIEALGSEKKTRDDIWESRIWCLVLRVRALGLWFVDCRSRE